MWLHAAPCGSMRLHAAPCGSMLHPCISRLNLKGLHAAPVVFEGTSLKLLYIKKGSIDSGPQFGQPFSRAQAKVIK